MNTFKTASLGFQHLLAMYTGAAIVPLIVGGAIGLGPTELAYLVAIDLFMCGVATLLQVWTTRFTGVGLPVVLGCTFTAVGPMIAIGSANGITAIYGALIASGLIVILISGFVGKLVRFFPPVVLGSVVTIIGLSLIPVAVNDIGGGMPGEPGFASMQNLGLGGLTILLILVLNRVGTVFTRAAAVLFAVLVGTGVAASLGLVDFSPVREAGWFQMVQPFYFGMPTFDLSAILVMTLVAIISMIESTGVFLALSDITKQPIGAKELTKGYRAEGVATILGGIFNSFPYTTFSQNVGLVQLSGVKSRRVIFWTGGLLILLGFLPKVATFTTLIPKPVLGGAMLVMFGTVAASGIRILSQVDFSKNENLITIALSIGVGLGITANPAIVANMPEWLQLFTDSAIVAGSFTALALNGFFRMMDRFRPGTIIAEERQVS
ncbi:nucleobase:cation symporter-2 family protein [Exiguobacterium profundum]|uniref:nucleobase:cation symporter-2 family protein n=1 Tax=Exiguobacterium TaxID=33986 RepID=UPI001BFC1397|nr:MULTISPECIES: nucleobase:cation symporter-2 family protein [Exiguobacterium]MCT4799069.1 purine permease [Exiguobacterium profundum]